MAHPSQQQPARPRSARRVVGTSRDSILDGSTVLITGASSGIGMALARYLAVSAGRLVLVARRAHRLASLSDELVQAHPGLSVHAMSCDLTDASARATLPDRVAAEVGDVDVLVNNAGAGHEELFDRADPARLVALLELNVAAVVDLTRQLVPGMVARGRGAVVMIGSGAGHMPLPGAAVYVGTKHFLHGFSEALRMDLAGTGVTVTEVAPGPVTTEFDQAAGIDGSMPGGPPPFMRMGAEECARVIRDGLVRRRALVFPGRAYGAVMTVSRLAPRSVVRASGARTARRLRSR